ncbi:MAG: hypothetical protein ACYC91_13460 [Solirubrobacteraceae bacterium]
MSFSERDSSDTTGAERDSSDTTGAERDSIAAADQAIASPPRTTDRRTGRLAVSLLQVASLVGVAGLAIIAGAVLVDDTKVPGWIDGLAIGGGAIMLTLAVLVGGRRARRASGTSGKPR